MTKLVGITRDSSGKKIYLEIWVKQNGCINEVIEANGKLRIGKSKINFKLRKKPRGENIVIPRQIHIAKPGKRFGKLSKSDSKRRNVERRDEDENCNAKRKIFNK